MLSTDSSHFETLPKNCFGKESVDEFKSCINEIDLGVVKNINIESYIQGQLIYFWGVNQIIIPSDGSIQNKGITQANSSEANPPTFTLDPRYDYNLYLYDKDSFLHLKNPAIIERSVTRIRANSSIVIMYIKV